MKTTTKIATKRMDMREVMEQLAAGVSVGEIKAQLTARNRNPQVDKAMKQLIEKQYGEFLLACFKESQRRQPGITPFEIESYMDEWLESMFKTYMLVKQVGQR